MGERYRSMNYLTVNAEDYLRPHHHRLSRSITPNLGAGASFDSRSDTTSELSVSASNKSLLELSKESLSDAASMDSLALHKSSESLCMGKAMKLLHRRARVTEVYRSRCNTDPGLQHAADRRLGVVPILTIPGAASLAPTPLARRKHMSRRSSALSSLIEQTLMVTTATVGFKTASDERLAQQSSKPLSEDVKRGISRSASSVVALANANTDASMAPLQSHAEAHSVTCLNTRDHNNSSPRSKQQKQQQKLQQQQFRKQLSASGSTQSGYSSANSSINESNPSLSSPATGNNRSETRPLKHSSSSLNPFGSAASSVGVRSLSPSRRSVSSQSSNTAKHEQSTAAAAAATAVAAAPPEKEKKRKEVSSSRVKKFHRHFTQVPKDEKLINYFSCALVSDILLQGHLYITEQHFAFHSNVFGYITKVVIPTSSVTKISKEKTAKIIPNAVGVATADERHVFGSFISREAAFRLMCSVCTPHVPVEIIAKMPADIEISEEYSIEDDSSCSISGNESPPQLAGAGQAQAQSHQAQSDDNNGSSQALLMRRTAVSSSLNIPANANKSSAASSAQHAIVGVRTSAPPATHFDSAQLTLNAKGVAAAFINTPTTGAAASAAGSLTMIIAGTASSTATSASSSSTPSSSSSPPTTVAVKPRSAVHAAADSLRALSQQTLRRLKFPTELHIVYVGVMLSVVLALFSIFLLYRILAIEAKTGYSRSPADFNWRSGNDEDIFAEALRWQKELQTKSSDEAQNILNSNLEQIAKVRRSLETLSMLIQDRSSAYTNRDDSD